MTYRFACLALALLALSACAGGSSRKVDLRDLSPPPESLPPSAAGAADALLGGGGFTAVDPDLDWGDGVLRPSGSNGFARIQLPLFDSPGGRHWGWITRGRIYDRLANSTLPDRSEAAVRVLGGRAFLVLDQTEDGWLKIRYGSHDDRGGGLAWTRADLARGGDADFVRWSRALEGARGLVYRNAEAAHNLRDGPSSNAAIVARLEGEAFDMTALEIRGDWMRVRVSSPPACAGTVAEDLLLGGGSTSVEEGWIAWRSAERGPWVMSEAGPRCEGGA